MLTLQLYRQIRHLNDSLYKRLRTVIENSQKRFFVLCNEHHRSTYIDREPNESCNDRNDRAIRVSAAWYEEHLKHLDIEIILLTNDKDNRDKAIMAGLKSYEVGEVWVYGKYEICIHIMHCSSSIHT